MKKILVMIAISTMLSSSAYAESGSFAFGPKVGTQGIGFEMRTPFSEDIFFRVSGNYLKINENFNKGALNYKAKLTLASAPVMVDWHPFSQSGFRISGGVAYNGTKLEGTAKPTENVRIGGIDLTPDELGTVSAKLKFGNPIAAIATIGYDSSFKNNSAWSFVTELGFMYTGSPKLTVSTTGSGANIEPILKADAKKALKDAKKYMEFYPVVSIGVKYVF